MLMLLMMRRHLLRVGQRHLSTTSRSRLPKDGLTLADFVSNRRQNLAPAASVAVDDGSAPIQPLAASSFHLKTYGCQMNVSDSDIVRSLLLEAGMKEVSEEADADVLLTNTCAIRDNAEAKVWHRLKEIKGKHNKHKKKKLVGVLGCMAERLKEDLFTDSLADLVVGPDAYRDLPRLVGQLSRSSDPFEQAVNVQLSLEETYADVTPVRHDPHNNVSAFVSCMRGCNNMCSYCVVPFTRGRERSRPYDSIVDEARHLYEVEGVKEIVLLGQNVNSYHDKSESAVAARPTQQYKTSNEGFTNLYRLRGGAGYYFADLVEAVSDVSPELRVRFTSPHPKDYPPELLGLMAERANVCNSLHMPAQSGSSSVLKRMRRGYTREAYLQLLEDVKGRIPDVAISSDFIAGFCSETDEEHADTISLMELVQYDQAFMFAYSMRGKTHAHRTMQDDVSEKTKQQRLQEIIDVFRTQVQRRNDETEVGRLRLVLLEGESKRSKPGNYSWHGRTDQNKRIVFPVNEDLACYDERDVRSQLPHIRASKFFDASRVPLQTGDYAVVQVTEARGHTLRGRLLWRTSLAAFTEFDLSRQDEQLLIDCLADDHRTPTKSMMA